MKNIFSKSSKTSYKFWQPKTESAHKHTHSLDYATGPAGHVPPSYPPDYTVAASSRHTADYHSSSVPRNTETAKPTQAYSSETYSHPTPAAATVKGSYTLADTSSAIPSRDKHIPSSSSVLNHQFWAPPTQPSSSSRKHRERTSDRTHERSHERSSEHRHRERTRDRTKDLERDSERRKDDVAHRRVEYDSQYRREKEREKEERRQRDDERPRESSRHRRDRDRETTAREKDPMTDSSRHHHKHRHGESASRSRDYEPDRDRSRKDPSRSHSKDYPSRSYSRDVPDEGESSDGSRRAARPLISGHRRHRTEEERPSIAVLQSTHKRSSSYQQPGVVADSGDERAVHLPVHLPSKSVGVTRHHDLDDPPTGQSGSETEQRQRRGNAAHHSREHREHKDRHRPRQDSVFQAGDPGIVNGSLRPSQTPTGYRSRPPIASGSVEPPTRSENSHVVPSTSTAYTPTLGPPTNTLPSSSTVPPPLPPASSKSPSSEAPTSRTLENALKSSDILTPTLAVPDSRSTIAHHTSAFGQTNSSNTESPASVRKDRLKYEMPIAPAIEQQGVSQSTLTSKRSLEAQLPPLTTQKPVSHPAVVLTQPTPLIANVGLVSLPEEVGQPSKRSKGLLQVPSSRKSKADKGRGKKSSKSSPKAEEPSLGSSPALNSSSLTTHERVSDSPQVVSSQTKHATVAQEPHLMSPHAQTSVNGPDKFNAGNQQGRSQSVTPFSISENVPSKARNDRKTSHTDTAYHEKEFARVRNAVDKLPEKVAATLSHPRGAVAPPVEGALSPDDSKSGTVPERVKERMTNILPAPISHTTLDSRPYKGLRSEEQPLSTQVWSSTTTHAAATHLASDSRPHKNAKPEDQTHLPSAWASPQAPVGATHVTPETRLYKGGKSEGQTQVWSLTHAPGTSGHPAPENWPHKTVKSEEQPLSTQVWLSSHAQFGTPQNGDRTAPQDGIRDTVHMNIDNSLPRLTKSSSRDTDTVPHSSLATPMEAAPGNQNFQHPKLAELLSSPSQPSPAGKVSFHIAQQDWRAKGGPQVYSSASQAAQRSEAYKMSSQRPPGEASEQKGSSSSRELSTPGKSRPTPPSPSPGLHSTPPSRHSPASLSKGADSRLLQETPSSRSSHLDKDSPSAHHHRSTTLQPSSASRHVSSADYAKTLNRGSEQARGAQQYTHAGGTGDSARYNGIYSSTQKKAYPPSINEVPVPNHAQSLWQNDIRTKALDTSRRSGGVEGATRGSESVARPVMQKDHSQDVSSRAHIGYTDMYNGGRQQGAETITRPSSRLQGESLLSAAQTYQPPQDERPPSTQSKMTRAPSEDSLLKTPSSLAHSILKPTVSRSSISSQQDSKKRSGFLGIFRSKASQPQNHEVWHPPSSEQISESSDLPRRTRQEEGKPLSSRVKVPAPLKVPPATQHVPISGRKSPNSKVFTPFRYLTTRRNRTVSAASAEAVAGTTANTVIGSPTASMHSQNPLQPPPIRDPAHATQQWRQELHGGGVAKIQRPGVVFDVAEEPSQDKQRLRPVKKSQLIANPTSLLSSVGRDG